MLTPTLLSLALLLTASEETRLIAAARHGLPADAAPPTPEGWRRWFATVAEGFPLQHERRRD